MNYEGLRDWLSIIEQRGELTTLEDVDWNLEMGAVVDVLYREHPPYPPALIFDRLKIISPAIVRSSVISPRRTGSRSPSGSKKNSIMCFNSLACITRK